MQPQNDITQSNGPQPPTPQSQTPEANATAPSPTAATWSNPSAPTQPLATGAQQASDIGGPAVQSAVATTGVPQPSSGPTPPAASYQPASTPTVTPHSPPYPPAAPAKNKWLRVSIVSAAAVIVIGLGVFLGLKFLGSTIKLETFSNSDFSVLIPVGYEKNEGSAGVTFEESEGSEDTHSEIIAVYEPIPEGIEQAQLDQVAASLKTSLEQAAKSSASLNGLEIDNSKTTDITFKGTKAVKITADANKDGKTVGTYTLVAGVTSKGIFMIGVGAHQTDPGLAKKIDTIINSFELK